MARLPLRSTLALMGAALASAASVGLGYERGARTDIRPHGRTSKPFRGRVIGYAPLSPPDKAVESKFRDEMKAAKRKRKRFVTTLSRWP